MSQENKDEEKSKPRPENWSLKPREVFVYSNGMVATVDKNGDQIPDLQGPIVKALPKIFDSDLSDLVNIHWQTRFSARWLKDVQKIQSSG